MLRNRTRLNMTRLEDRLTPAASLSFVNGNLSVTGDNTGNWLALTATANNQISVAVNGSPVGTYAVTGNLTVSAGNSSDTVDLNLNGNSLGGNFTLNTGSNGLVADAVTVSNGTISGRISITTSLGNDGVTLTGVIANGLVNTFNGGAGSDSLTVVTSTLAGINLVNGFNMTNFVSDATGQIVANSAAEGLPVSFIISGGATVTGDVTIIGGAGSDTATISGTVTGNLTFSAGAGDNALQLFGTSIGGNVNGVFSSGADLVSFATATVAGSAQFSMGDGNNQYNFADLGSLVGGGFTLSAGNGNDYVGDLSAYVPASSAAAGASFSMTVLGNVNVNLGNGNNTLNLQTPSGLIAGNGINVTTGGGSDAVQVNGSYNAAALRVNLGAGSDFFIWGAAAGVLSADIDGGAGVDTYVQIPAVIPWSQKLINF